MHERTEVLVEQVATDTIEHVHCQIEAGHRLCWVEMSMGFARVQPTSGQREVL